MSTTLRLIALASLALGAGGRVVAADVIPPAIYTTTPTGVNVSDGAFVFEVTDLSIGPLKLERHHVGAPKDSHTPYFGVRMSHNFDIYVSPNTTPASPPFPNRYKPIVHIGRSASGTYKQSVAATPVISPSSIDATTTTLTKVGSAYVYTDHDGVVYTFNPAVLAAGSANSQRIDNIVYPSGRSIKFTYNASAQLKVVTDNSGYAIVFDYGSFGTVSAACGFNLTLNAVSVSSTCAGAGLKASYSYVSGGSPPISGPRLTAVVDVMGQSTTYAYQLNEINCIKPPGYSNCKITNTYPVNGTINDNYQVRQQTLGDGTVWNYSFGNGYQTRDPDYVAGDGEQSGSVTDPLNNVSTYFFTKSSPYSATDPLGRVTQYRYTGGVDFEYLNPPTAQGGLLVQADLPDGQQFIAEYTGNLTSPTRKTWKAKASSGLPDIVAQYGYPPNCDAPYSRANCTKPVWSKDAKGNQTDFIYSAVHGGVLSETLPPDATGVRPQKRYTYNQFYAWYKDSSGVLAQGSAPIWLLTQISECRTAASCAGNSDETLTTYTYGASGLANNLVLTSQTTAAGDGNVSATKAFTYDSVGNKITEDGPMPGTADTKRWRYDMMRRVTGTASPDPDGAGPLPMIATRNTYDAPGRLTKVETGTVTDQSDAAWIAFSPLETLSTFYDAMDRKIKESKSNGAVTYAVTQLSYDPVGRLQCSAIRMDPAQWAGQTDACVPQTTGPNGPDRISKNLYDAAGQVTTVQRAYGTPLQQDYVSYTYSLNGKPATVTDAKGNKASMTYDGHHRQAAWNFPSKTTPGAVSTTDYEAYTYDLNGNRTSLRKRDGQMIGYAYDALDRMVTKTKPEYLQSVAYTYLLTSQMTGANFPTGLGVSRGYDALGRVNRQDDSTTDATHPSGWDRGPRYSYYDANGNREAFAYGGQTFLYQYDGLDRVTRIGDGYGNELIRIAYDAQGRRSTLTKVAGAATPSTTTYTYDPISRLSGVSHDLNGTAYDVNYSFAYNPASQMTTRTVSNNSYAYTNYMNVNRPYVVNGLNQYSSAGTGGGAATFTYDANGNLISDGTVNFGYDTENRLVAASGANRASLLYDPLGHLVRTNNGTGTPNTWFMYDGDTLIAEYDDSGAITKRFLQGPGVDEPLAWFDGYPIATGNRHDLFANHQGSIVAVADGNGVGQAINRYDEYGIANPGAFGRFQYTGQAWIPELGLSYYKARMYSPKMGRFMQTDPVGYDDQVNLYAYVGNDPVNNEDPSGECTGSNIQGNDGQCAGGGFVAGSGSCSGNCSPGSMAAAAAAPGRAAAGAAIGAGVDAGALATGGALAGTLLLCGDSPGGCRQRQDYWYLTYTKEKTVGGHTVTYSGRTAGYGKTPEAVLANRDRGHHMNALGFGRASVDRAVRSVATINDAVSRAAIRGREQMLIDRYGGARSQGGTSGNAINGIGSYNPLRPVYIGTAEAMFGNDF